MTTDRSPVRLKDLASDLLAQELLGGKKPTPARMRALLSELRERRGPPQLKAVEVNRPEDWPDKEIPMSTDLSRAASRAEPQPDDLPDAIEDAQIADARVRAAQGLAEKMTQVQRQPRHVPRKSRIQSLTEAAEILLVELDTTQRDRCQDIARELSVPVWAVMLGAVARAADLQELIAGEFKSDWLNQGDRLDVPKQEVCGMCQSPIPDARRHQKFCCSHHGSEKTEHTPGCVLGHIQMVKGEWVDTRTGVVATH